MPGSPSLPQPARSPPRASRLDLIGFLFFAAATGIGGGTVRDLVLGRTPVFWVINPTYILVCVSVAVLLFFTAHLFESVTGC